MKSWSIMLAAAFLLFLTSAVSSKSWGPEVGSTSPRFSVSNGHGTLSSAELKGKYILVQFWSAADPASRVSNKMLDNWRANHADDTSLVYLAVCVDSDSDIASRIIEVDRIESSSQFFAAENENSRIVEAFEAEDGNMAYLIAPDGKIIAKNPNEALLMASI